MLISLNAIKKYVDIKVSTEELIKLIGSRLVEVEGWTDLNLKYQNAFIVKVVECEPIEGTHLHLCKIDDGKSLVQVVCGATNVHKGMFTVWLAPGAIVPQTYGNEDFKLGVRKLRGYESNGMLAGIDELDLGDDHSGIIELEPKDIKPGDLFAEKFDLNDIILDIENKSLTHRPDCFGLIGFAREIAGILGQKFDEPEIFTNNNFASERLKSVLHQQNDCDISVEIADPNLCSSYGAAIIDVAKIAKPSKYFHQNNVFLAKAGMRSIDPIVDITNIIMLETGQPLHAFDYDKFVAVGKSKNPKILVRAAKDGEELQLLDEKTIKCTKNDIIITSDNHPVALAGAMGGLNTAIDASTKRIILESATFSLYNLRKTQMAHGIFSEAITRFTKGQPADISYPVLAEAAARLGGDVLNIVYENASSLKQTQETKKQSKNVVEITTNEINSLLGTDYAKDLIINTLQNVGFSVSFNEDSLNIEVPFWRTDIHIKEDIIEEVGRLLGYDNISIDYPKRPFIGSSINEMFSLKSELRNILSGSLSANEVLTYSFISKKLLEKVGQNPEDSYEITNSISPELQCFRQSIVPSLLDKTRANLKAGYSDFTIYEINQIARKSDGLTKEKTPLTYEHLGILTTGDYYQIKSFFEYIAKELKISLKIQKISNRFATYLEPRHAVDVYLGDKLVGSFGEVKNSVLRQFKLEKYTISACELRLDEILNEKNNAPQKIASMHISKFPSVERDITFKASSNITFASVFELICGSLRGKDLIFSVAPTSIYQSEKDSSTKNLSFHLKFSDKTHTLQSSEISDIIDEVIKVITETLGVEVV